MDKVLIGLLILTIIIVIISNLRRKYILDSEPKDMKIRRVMKERNCGSCPH